MRRKILLCLFLLILVFIWGQSCLPVSLSREESSRVLAFLRPFLELIFGRETVTHHLVRKLAHFTEFFALGAEFSFLIINEKKVSIAGVSLILLAGLVSALSDETVQLFFERGSSVMDVWLDFGGYCTAVALILLIFFAVIRFKKDRPNLA